MTTDTKTIREPFFNVPPLTGFILLAMVALHFLRLIEPFPIERRIIDTYAFVPVQFMHDPMHYCYTVFTYAALHFGWLHVCVNGFGLLAFGAGVERAMGAGWMIVILCAGIVAGALGHTMIFYDSDIALGGISAGVSALFAASMVLLGGRRSILSGSAVFILTNIVVGGMGMPDQPGLAIAWQAHIFGFIMGLILVSFKKGRRI